MKIKQSARFKKDLKTARKRGMDMDLPEAVVELIARKIFTPAECSQITVELHQN